LAALAAVGLALVYAAPAAATGFEALSSHGGTVLKVCNPTNSGSSTTCRVATLPGEPGYNQVATRNEPIIVNGVTVGTQYETVWRHCTDLSLYIFGLRVQMNATAWDGTGLAFNVNDIQRQVRTDQSVSVAYHAGSPAATKLLQNAGRTFDGLNEYTGSQPARNNGWVDFRVDANAHEQAGTSSAWSPWVLAKVRAPEGYALQSFAVRLLNSDLADPTDETSIYTSAYQPICTSDDCAPDTGDDD